MGRERFNEAAKKIIPNCGLSPALRKALMVIGSGGKCCFPTCSSCLSPEQAFKHHWNFKGKRRVFDDLRKIHLCCRGCHDRIHIIAAVMIFYLEFFGSIQEVLLVRKVAGFLGEDRQNVFFVLKEEFKPAGLVAIKEGRYQLLDVERWWIDRIKQYLEINRWDLFTKLNLIFN
ncbi:MAG: hypothetical protein CMI55_02010 [Parcubacteria group bacterium]|jgi:hypothetical protein|nr:hypothetical protein [Parcubacteria group bacterium]|tara:strand:+ start:2875 stop:3393 length:519 start_codon:yes stop_codon:yes gene_type:complete